MGFPPEAARYPTSKLIENQALQNLRLTCRLCQGVRAVRKGQVGTPLRPRKAPALAYAHPRKADTKFLEGNCQLFGPGCAHSQTVGKRKGPAGPPRTGR